MSSWKRKFYRIEWYWSLGRLLCLQPLTWQDVKIEIDSIKGITYVYSRHMNICRDFTKTRSGEEEEEKEKHFIKILFRNAQCIANGRETLAARCFHSERNHSAWTQHHMANNQQQARHAKLKKRGEGGIKETKLPAERFAGLRNVTSSVWPFSDLLAFSISNELFSKRVLFSLLSRRRFLHAIVFRNQRNHYLYLHEPATTATKESLFFSFLAVRKRTACQ